jgi:hypothetical protein
MLNKHNRIIKGIFNVFALHSKTFIIWKWNCTTETELGDLMIKMYMKNMSDLIVQMFQNGIWGSDEIVLLGSNYK